MARYIKDCDCAKVISEKFNIPLGDVIDIVYDIPTADVVEVKHGEWENFEIPHMMRCSECGVGDLDIHRTKFAFCPYCGTKMDGTPKERGGEK